MAADLPPELQLDRRTGLPDALRVLLEEYPRRHWEGDPGFDGLIRFWLDRHLMFRRMLELLRQDAEARIDGGLDPAHYPSRLSRLGGQFIDNLHGHHMIEDHHYFPVLAGRDARVEHGFDLLEADHVLIDGLLERFATSANAVLRADGSTAQKDATGAFLATVTRAEGLLDRHLTDEEELVVPVILKYGTDGLPG